LASIAQLSQLTSLSMYSGWEDSEQPLRQLLAQPLQLRELQLEPVLLATLQLLALDMAALTQLTMLSIKNWPPSGVMFPTQLQDVNVWQCKSGSTFAAAVAPLQQLTRIELNVHFQDVQALAQLAQLPNLQALTLTYEGDTDCAITAAATAAAWPQLSALHSLSIDCETSPSRQQMAAILAGIAAATSLEHLSLMGCSVWEDAILGQDDAANDGDELLVQINPAAVCSSLIGLTKLKHLSLVNSALVLHDALALTALTGLTSLNLQGLGPAVTDVVATALACSLRQLRDLDLSGCHLGDVVCLAAIGQLTQLSKLSMREVEGVTEQGLGLLTKMSCLQTLEVQTEESTDEVLARFWAALQFAQPQPHEQLFNF
jgi:hypothetical protein